jgi:hypothetical protein
VLATIGLALAESGSSAEAAVLLAELGPEPDFPFAVLDGSIAMVQGEPKRAAESFARAVEAHQSGDDPRDLLMALLGVVIATPEAELRAEAVRRLGVLCRQTGIMLLPRERAHLGPADLREIAAG